MIYDRPKFIQKRRAVPRPVSMIVGQRPRVPGVSRFQCQVCHDWAEDHGLFAPAAKPAIAPENPKLHDLGKRTPFNLGCAYHNLSSSKYLRGFAKGLHHSTALGEESKHRAEN